MLVIISDGFAMQGAEVPEPGYIVSIGEAQDRVPMYSVFNESSINIAS